MSLFPPKSAVLVANIQGTLTWSGSDFQQTLGDAQPELPMSVAFTVQNQTAQVVYIGVQYTTRSLNYALNDGRNIAGIPAGQTVRVSAATAPALASFPGDLVSISLSLTSAAAGTVTVSLEAGEPQGGAGGAGSALIGLDDRTTSDYIQVRLALSQLVAGGNTVNQLYTVPVGKRAEIVSFSADCSATPFGDGDCTVTLTSSAYLKTLRSQQFVGTQIFLSGGLCYLESAQSAQLILTNFNPNPAVEKVLSGIVILKEFF